MASEEVLLLVKEYYSKVYVTLPLEQFQERSDAKLQIYTNVGELRYWAFVYLFDLRKINSYVKKSLEQLWNEEGSIYSTQKASTSLLKKPRD